MKESLLHLFHIFPGEERRAALLAGLGVLWASATSCAVKLSESLFILHVGSDALFQCYFFIACGLFIVAAPLIHLVQRYSAYHIFSGLNLLTAAIYASFALIFFMKEAEAGPGLWTATIVCAYLCFLIHVTCYWSFVDEYFDLQDAKRLFSLFCSAIFVGMGFAGGLLGAHFFSLPGLFVFLSTLCLTSFLWARWIRMDLESVYDDTKEEDDTNERVPWRQALRTILSSPLTLLLMTIPAIVQCCEVLTEFSYCRALENYMTTSGRIDELPQFIGQLASWVALISIVISLLLTNRLIHRLGLGNMVLLIPASYLFMFGGWIVAPSLCFPIFGFTITEGLHYVIQENSTNLLLNVVPTQLKNRIRVLLDFFAEPAGVLLGSLLLMLPNVPNLYLGLSVSAIALALSIWLRSHYGSALVSQLSSQRISFSTTAQQRFLSLSETERRHAQHLITQELRSNCPVKQLLALEMALAFPDPCFLALNLKQLSHISTASRLCALELIGNSTYANHPSVLTTVKQWAYEADEIQIRCAALFYLAKRDQIQAQDVAIYLDSPNLHLRAAALVTLHRQGDESSAIQQRLLDMLKSPHENELLIAIDLLACGLLPHTQKPLLTLLKHPAATVRQAAAAGLELTAKPSAKKYAPALLEHCAHSKDPLLRQHLIAALGKLGDSQSILGLLDLCQRFCPRELRLAEQALSQLGSAAEAQLLSYAQDHSHHPNCRLLTLRVLRQISPEQQQLQLQLLVESTLDQAYFYFYHRHSIRRQYPLIHLGPLEDVLAGRLSTSLDFLLQLLAVDGTLSNAELLSHSLRSPNAKIRGNAIETLETSCSPTLFQQLYPLVAPKLPYADILRLGQQRGCFSMTLKALLEQLETSPSLTDQLTGSQIRAMNVDFLQLHLEPLPSEREATSS